MKFGITKRNFSAENELDTFRNGISTVFDDFFNTRTTELFDTSWKPVVDVVEDANEIHVRAELPGMEEKDLTITFQNNMLTISGEKTEERKEESKEGKRYMVSERIFGSFSRSISLPEGVDADKINARFRNGLLSVEIPKGKKAKSRKISIK